jgi:hypothetical protein
VNNVRRTLKKEDSFRKLPSTFGYQVLLEFVQKCKAVLCLSQKPPAPYLMTFLEAAKDCVSIPWTPDSIFVYGSNFHPRDPAEIGPKWLEKQALDHTSEQHWDV